MFYVYILRLRDGTFYVGFTSDLKRRFKNHNEKIVWSTKKLTPVELVFYAVFSSKYKAIQFEKYLKSSSGFAFRNKHLI